MKLRLLLASIAIATTIGVQGQDWANHELTLTEIEQEWNVQQFFTIGSEETPNIRTYFLSFALAYPNEFLHEMIGKMMGVPGSSLKIGNYVEDTKNGYISGELLAQFESKVQMCYWRMNNGNILIGVAFEGYNEGAMAAETEDEMDESCENGMMFYVIEKETVIWRPRTLFAVCGRDFHLPDYKIDLPRVGKDIQLTFNKENKSGNSWLLKWNGSGFNVVKK